MSHFTSIATCVRDLDALSDACVELGLQLLPNTTCRGFNGITRHAPHVIQLSGPYDIAVDPSNENPGSFDLTADLWDSHVEREVGAGYGRLLQCYGVHKTLREANLRGLRTSRHIEQDGTILLTLEGGSL